MKTATTIKFINAESNDEGLIILRYNEALVMLCLSLKSNGDIEVAITKDHAKRLLEALKEAVE
jgi:hypothetical protein